MSIPLARRQFLQFLSGSPLLAMPWSGLSARPELAQPESIDQVLNVWHLERVAQQTLDAPAWHYVTAAADDHRTKIANREAWGDYALRPRHLVDVSKVDTSVTLFGKEYKSPLILCPVGGQQMFHEGGELATGRAAARRKHLMICSTVTNFSVGEIAETGANTWFQLYVSKNRPFMKKLLDDAKAAGCDTFAITVDSPSRGNLEAVRWFAKQQRRAADATTTRMGNFEDFDGPKGIGNPALTWDDLKWFRDTTDLNLVLKGIVTAEDAERCAEYGVDGVIVSNHGGRASGNERATLDALPEIVEALKGRMPVLIDGGVRRGSDIYTALALGADAVCIGRPYVWGLGAYGQPGVEKCLSILQAELVRTMRNTGTPTIADIDASYVERTA